MRLPPLPRRRPPPPPSPDARRYAAESEILLRIALAGHPIDSIPVQTIYAAEASKIHPLADAIRFYRMLHRFKKLRRRILRQKDALP